MPGVVITSNFQEKFSYDISTSYEDVAFTLTWYNFKKLPCSPALSGAREGTLYLRGSSDFVNFGGSDTKLSRLVGTL